MTRTKIIKILEDAYKKYGNVPLVYLYDFYLYQYYIEKDIVEDTNKSFQYSDVQYDDISIQSVLLYFKNNENLKGSDDIHTDLLIKPNILSFEKVARGLYLNTCNNRFYDMDNWYPVFVSDSYKIWQKYLQDNKEIIKQKDAKREASMKRFLAGTLGMLSPYLTLSDYMNRKIKK